MNTPASKPKPSIDLSALHPVIAQALAPHVYGGVRYACADHMRDVIQSDDKALRLQMNQPQTVEGWFL